MVSIVVELAHINIHPRLRLLKLEIPGVDNGNMVLARIYYEVDDQPAPLPVRMDLDKSWRQLCLLDDLTGHPDLTKEFRESPKSNEIIKTVQKALADLQQIF